MISPPPPALDHITPHTLFLALFLPFLHVFYPFNFSLLLSFLLFPLHFPLFSLFHSIFSPKWHRLLFPAPRTPFQYIHQRPWHLKFVLAQRASRLGLSSVLSLKDGRHRVIIVHSAEGFGPVYVDLTWPALCARRLPLYQMLRRWCLKSAWSCVAKYSMYLYYKVTPTVLVYRVPV